MSPSDDSERTDNAQSVDRRRFLWAAGAVGISSLVAGCGDGGPAVTTTEPPNGSPTGTGTPTSMESPTETGPGTETETASPMETETATETQTATETETPTPTETETATGTPAGDAMVRVGHLSPNAPNVDVYVDDSVVLEDVPFGAVSEYLALAAGTHTVTITAAGDPDTVAFEGDVTVEAGMDYTIAAIGELGADVGQEFRPLVLADDNEPPASDTARLRAVHASPDAPAVDITAGDTVLFDGVPFGESGYVEVPAGDYTVDIRGDTESNDGDIVASFDVSLAGGTVYTAWAAGYLTPDDEPADVAFDLLVSEDTS